jgi:hypothetical protein
MHAEYFDVGLVFEKLKDERRISHNCNLQKIAAAESLSRSASRVRLQMLTGFG